MKRIIIAAVIAIGLIGSANAQPSSANALASFPNLRNPVLLAAPADLPDVAECHGILSQVVLDIVNNATDDPAETFEKNRREHPHMIMMPAPLECASKLFQAIRRNPHFTSFASVPKGTEALSLRQYPVDALFNLRALSASVGSNVDPSGGVEGYQGENNIAIDPNNPQHIIAHSNTFFRDTSPGCQSPTGGAANTYGTMSLFGSTDGGATWTYNCAPWPATITGGVAGADAWFGSDPALAWDNQGRAYATYMLISLNSSTNASGAAIVTARSSDNGASWQNLGTVTNGITSTTIGNDKEMMAIDNTSGQPFSHPGRIYVIWDAANNEKIAFSDNGTSWTAVNFASNSGAIGGNVVVGVDGTVYVIWNRYNVETIVFSKSTDGGATWTAPAVISTMALQSFGTNNLPPAQNSRGVNAFGSIDIDRNPASAFFGNLYVSFPDFPTGTTSGSDINTYVIRSTNGGTNWSSRVKVNDDNFGATQIFPWLAVDQSDGSVNVSWYDSRLDPLNRKTQMVYARSTDGGLSFEPNILLTDGGLTWRNNVNYSDENSTDNSAFNGNQYGDYSGIAALNRQVHPLWTDSRMFFPVADTQSPTRREDNATNVIVNCSAPAALAAPAVNPTTAPSVVVSWSAPAGWGTNATSGTYSVYRNTTNTFPGGSPLVSGLTSTNYVDTTGTVSTTYFYFVRAKNNCPGTALTPMTTDSPASAGVVFGASGAAVGTLQGTVTSAGNPVSGATVTAGAFSATTNGSGFYQLAAITAATYTVGASATGYNSTSVPGVVVSGGGTTVQNFSLTPTTTNTCFTDTTYSDFGAGSGTSVDIATSPGNVRLGLTGSETIDQNSVPGSLFATNNITATQWIGQTFRAGASGNLTTVTLDLGLASGGTSGTITLEIRNISGTLPGSTVLATATVGPITNVGTAANYLATFASPALVVSGTSYSIVLKANTGSTAFAVRGNSSSLANGQWFLTTNSGGSWSANTQDIYFATYVTPTALQPSGNLVSSTKDSSAVTGTTTTWTTLSWTATTPANTTVKFQAAASNNAAGPFTFVGPDGTAATFFTTTGASLSQFNGKRYLQHKAFLSTTDTSVTPTLSDVTVCEQVVDCSSSVPTVTPTPARVCPSATGNTASGPAGMSTYAWSITNGTITAGATAQSVTYTAGVSGSVGLTLTITTASGCQAIGSATVPINPTPTASNTGPYCAGATISLSTPTVAGATYAWSGPNGFTSALQNPTRSNATTADAGTYSVTVTVSGCTSAAGSTSVVVNPIPATPTASNGGPYCTGGTISLSTPLVAGGTYAWTGPNGFTSSLQNPTRTNAAAADAGTYSVTVTVNGCTSAAGTTSVVVNATPATPTASNGGPYCAGATISLSTPTVAGATYAWTGPNGFTSAVQSPTRSNATTADGGTYSVTVTVNGCPSAAGSTTVVVNAIPATPTASNGGPYCVGGTITLSTPTVAGATYAWSGPNGFTSALQSPTRSSATLADAGTYSVTITVSGCTSAAGTTSVVVNPTPATPTASNGGPYCEGGLISLSTPTVAGAIYAWSGPNGFTSALQNPTRASATIADAGTYSVTITVSGCTSAAGTTSVVVNPTPATPTASNGGPYCAGATIQLSTPTVAGATYAWSGPNSFTSALQNPTRSSATTADAGVYSVTITVSGCPSAAGTTTVVVNPIPATPTASNGGPYCEGGLIALSTPTVAGATYAWTGPNGFTSALQNPTRASATLADAGTYSVTITVSGCTSAAGTTNVVVNPTPATPTASNGGPYCEGAAIQLSTPTVSGATYSWSGPNGFTSALQNPSRTNATTADAGIYSVTITVNGCTSAAGTTNVVVNATPATPTASNGGPYCEGAMIQLSTPTVAGATYAWTGPNGFTSALQNPTRTNATTADAGTYSVTITVSGCSSAAGTTTVVVNPIPATPTASNGGPYCEGASIQLSTPTVSGATYSWTGPNSFTSALQNPTRTNATIADAGTYSVTVAVNGCTSAAGTTNVVVNPTPATPTASNGGPYCEGATIQLSTPMVSGATYAWTGPNGFTSALQNPTRSSATVADAGIYSVTVTVNGCTSAAGTTTVIVNPIPATPTASNGGPYCAGATIALSTPTVAGATYAWTGPNGFSSALQNPTRSNATVADAGTYSVTITVSGCTSAAGTTNVVVNPAPATPTASNGGPYCEGATIQLSTPTVAGATYAWTGPNAFTSALQNPTRSNATTADAGLYSVTVTVSGCTSAAGTTTVVVNATPATPTASNGGPYCEGATIQLSTPTVSGATYAWTGPNGFTSALQNPTRSSTTVADAGIYSVTVTVNGCTSAAGTTNVIVNPIPATPTASNGGPYCAGATIALSTPTVAGATYAWTGPNGFSSALQNPTRSNATVADAGTYSVTITVSGCTSAAGTTTVAVNPAPATPTASNGGPYCEGATIQLSTPTVAGATYAWTGPNAFTSALQNPTRASATIADAGTYSVTITVSGCTSAAGTTTVVVNATPATPTASNGGPYCEGATIALSTPTVSGATYAWTGPNGFTSALQNPTRSSATIADAGTYSVTITVSGCTSAAGTTTVVVNATPATPTASNGGPYCAGATIALSTPTVAGATYAWTGPNGFNSALQNPTRSNATVADAGTYSVTITVSGCTSAAGTTNVVVNPAPATPTASNGGPYCEGATIQLSTPTVAGATYAWTGPNAFTSALQNPTRSNATTADAGIYSVTVTVSGCTSAAGTTTVVVNATPATPTASNGGPYCEGATIALSTPTVAGATYAWTGPNGFTSALQNPTRSSATIADAGTYSVTITVNGCTSAAGTTNVVVNPTPATPTASNGGPYCEGATIALSTPTVAGATYAWTGPNGFTSALQNPTRTNATIADAGTYSVTITVSGCTSAAGTTNVVVNPIPATPTITPGGPTTFCSGGSVTLTSSSATGNQWFLNGNPIGGATNNTFSATASGNYSVTVTASGCTSAASAATSVTVNPIPATPTITPGGPTTFCAGGSVTLTSSSASGNQWLLNGNPIGGATNDTFTATASGNYTVTVTTNGCTSAASAATSVTVNPIPATPTITPSGPTTFCAGGSVTLTSSSASGNQWLLNGNPIGGATNDTFTATASGNYTVTVTANGCTSAASAATPVTVNPIPATPTITPGGPTTFCTGGSVTLTSSNASGNQWLLNGNPIGGATNNTFSATVSGNYTVTVTANGCTSAASAPTSVTVNTIPATPTITPGGPTTFCAGGSVTLTSSSASGNQWLLNGNPIGGATNNTFSATASGNYTVTVTANGCTSAASAGTSVTVNPIPATPTITPGGPTTFCTGGSVTLTSSSASGNQWLLNGNPIGGATNDTFSATVSGNYTVTVTANGCTSAASAPTSVTVNAIPATPTITPGGPTTFCTGGSVTLTSSSASGNQWSLNGNPIGGATNNTFSATVSGNYTVTVTASGCTSAASAATSVTVNPIPATPTITPGGPTTFCTGGSVTLTSSSASGNQWLLNGNPIGGATNATFGATVSGNYTVTVTTNGCTSAASAATSVTVNAIPATPTITPGGPTTFCTGGSVTLTSSSASGNQWLLNGNPIGGATNNTFSATVSGNYTVTVTTNGCTSAASAATSVTVNAIPATPTITHVTPTTFCAGGSVTLTSSSASGNQWFLNGSPIGGAVNQTFVASLAADYTVVVTTNGCASAASAATTVTINPNPNATITTPAGVVAGSTGNTASVANAGAGATYNWSITNGTITAGTGTSSITFTAGAIGTLTLNVTVTTAAGCSDTKSANVNVTAGTAPVTVTSVAPASGSTSGGTAVTINGTGFAAGAGVTFGGTAATNVVVVSAIKITAITPAHAAGSVNVTVTNTNTTSGTLTSGYLYATLFDPNGDGVIDPADIFFLINYLFLNGPPPHGTAGLMSGDANGDGVVDPADIFYLINYLFLGGPKPHSVPGTVTAASIRGASPQIAGSIALGKAVRRGGHYVVPVILTSRGEAPQAMSLRVRFDDDAAIGDVAIRRAGVAKDVVFETSRRSGNDVSYLVAYDPRGLVLGASRSAVVAEIEIESVEGHVAIAIDPQLTMLSDQAGTTKATVANRKLEVSGTTIDFLPRTRVPGHEVN